jgi:hypothetical protein
MFEFYLVIKIIIKYIIIFKGGVNLVMAKGGYDLHHHSNFINLNSKVTTVHMELFFETPRVALPLCSLLKKC